VTGDTIVGIFVLVIVIIASVAWIVDDVTASRNARRARQYMKSIHERSRIDRSDLEFWFAASCAPDVMTRRLGVDMISFLLERRLP